MTEVDKIRERVLRLKHEGLAEGILFSDERGLIVFSDLPPKSLQVHLTLKSLVELYNMQVEEEGVLDTKLEEGAGYDRS
jgi:hypothetical protein